MGLYYDIIMEPIKGSFSDCFNKRWQNQLDQLAKPYSNALQLRIGNHLRPKLTCWGTAFNTKSVDELDVQKAAEIASYIEMLHKASILIDDMIDRDDARHGQAAFHKEFSKDDTMVFAVLLLAKGAAGINNIFKDSTKHAQAVALYADTIANMATGCLEELSLDSESKFSIQKIRRIIHLETTTLITNSLLLGYWSNHDGSNKLNEIDSDINNIGNNCGYIFQILNDLEPFSANGKNIAHKKSLNIDIVRERKNIAVAYIYGAATSKERANIMRKKDEELQEYVLGLYDKYSVGDAIKNEAYALERETMKIVDLLEKKCANLDCVRDFRRFVREIIEICFSRVEQL